MTPELAAERAAQALDRAITNCLDPAVAAALVSIADGWTRLHAALAASKWLALDPTEQPKPPLNRLATAMANSTLPADIRDRAREWIDGFHDATEADRINCVALLLGAADDAYACAMDGHKTRAALLALGWTPPAADGEPGQVEPEPEQWNPYRERAALVAHLAAIYPSAIVHGADPSAPDWPVIFIATPQGQMSWHLAAEDLGMFGHVEEFAAPDVEGAPTWDGHSTAEKYERLHALTGDQAAKTIEPEPIGYLLVQGEGDYYELCAHGPDPIDATPDRLRAVLANEATPRDGRYVLCKLIPLDF